MADDARQPQRDSNPAKPEDIEEFEGTENDGQNRQEPEAETFETYDEEQEYFEAERTDEMADPVEAIHTDSSEIGSNPLTGDAPVDLGLGVAPGAGRTAAARKASQRNLARGQAKAHAHQFKSFMTPILIFTALILFALGTLALVMIDPADSGPVLDDNGYQTRLPDRDGSGRGPMITYAAYASYPLGAILLLGAWVFHRDVRRANAG